MFPVSSNHRSQRHDGDLGNLRQTNDGIIDTTFNVQNMMLVGDRGILGRSAVVSITQSNLYTIDIKSYVAKGKALCNV